MWLKRQYSTHAARWRQKGRHRLYLLSQLTAQGLPSDSLQIIFHALILSKVEYAPPAIAWLLSETDTSRLDAFYRAMLCIRGTSHGPVSVSVCLSVTSRSSTKTAKRRITQTTSHDSPGTLVFGWQRYPRNSTGITPCGGAKYRWGGSKSATFDK